MNDTAIAAPAGASARPAPLDRGEWLALAGRARLLSWVSLAYMTLEGAIAITAGILAGSVALIGFGIDSAVEGFASLVIVWRFTGARLLSERAERGAQRLVAVQFFLLAPYVGFEAIQALATGERPDASWLGVGLAATSMVSMPCSAVQNSASPSAWDRSPPRARGSRTCCAHICLPRCWAGCSETPCSEHGGSTRPPPSSSLVSPSGRESRAGAARGAAPPVWMATLITRRAVATERGRP